MAAHYAIGLILGAGYALLLRVPQPRQSSVPRATAYGIATTVFPWFWMFPARGQGVMGLRDRDPRVPTFALCTHIAYGLGLGVALRSTNSWLSTAGASCADVSWRPLGIHRAARTRELLDFS
jgi:hypothetical protein